jgi:hypothetical protein
MRLKKWLVLSGVVVCVLAFALTLGLWVYLKTDLSEDEVTAVRQDRERLKRNYWEPLRLVGADGAEWFIPMAQTKDDPRMCWYVLAGKKHEVGQFADGWEFINHQAVALLPSGRPIIVWSGFNGEAGNERLAASTSMGESWSTPVILAENLRVRGLDVAVEKGGRVHVVFVSPLQRRESYGPIEGSFPSKCWWLIYDGVWSQPQPIQERGRFDVRDAILTQAPSGRVILSVAVTHQFDSGNPHLGAQVLGESGWSKLRKL